VYGASDFGHGAGDVRAQGEWVGDPGDERLARGLDGPVGGVDGHGGVLDDDFVVSGDGYGGPVGGVAL